MEACGTITACEAPHLFDLTWEFGGATSWVEVRLTEVSTDATRVSMSHIARPDAHWAQYGPGAVGIGWDLSFLGLSMHLATGGDAPAESTEWAMGEGGLAFMRGSGKAWIAADIASGADPDDATTRGTATIGFFTGGAPE